MGGSAVAPVAPWLPEATAKNRKCAACVVSLSHVCNLLTLMAEKPNLANIIPQAGSKVYSHKEQRTFLNHGSLGLLMRMVCSIQRQRTLLGAFVFFFKKIVQKKTVYERTFQTQKYGGALEHNG